MEDVLDLYAEPYDPDRPVVCFDETSTQLLADVRQPLPAQPGRPRRQDYEYRRGGTRNIFLFCEPLAGWRHLAITERRTMADFAHQMRWLVDSAYPDAPVIRVVLDNLNIHRMASLYETFPAGRSPPHRETSRVPPHSQTRQLAQSCPELAEGMAEIEYSVLSRDCLGDATVTRWHWPEPSTPTRPDATPPRPPSTGTSAPRTPRSKLHRLYPCNS